MTQTPHALPSRAARRAPELLERYRTVIVPALMKEFGRTNPMAVARLEKVVLNIGCGEAAHDVKVLEQAQRDLTLIAGQRPAVTRAKKAISNFKIREHDPIGCRVTLRRAAMYEFLNRFVHVALPRTRDFRGLNPKSFDQAGNFTFGLREYTIFPELKLDDIRQGLGMDVTLVIRSANPHEALALLKGFGFPFATPSQPPASAATTKESNGANSVA